MFESVMETYKNTAKGMSDLWRWITISPEGNVKKGQIMSQLDIFGSLPEINPRFFNNFGATEVTIRQKNGTQIIIKRVR